MIRAFDARYSLAAYLLRVIFGLYFLVALLVTLLQLYVEYADVKATVQREVVALEPIFRRGLSEAMWSVNTLQLQSITAGIYRLPVVVGLEVRSEDEITAEGRLLVQRGLIRLPSGETQWQESFPVADAIADSALIVHEFPLIYEYEGTSYPLGRAVFYSSEGIVFERVRYGFLLILVNSFIKTGVLWCIFLLVIRKVLGRPLTALTSRVQQLDLDTLDDAEVREFSQREDELNQLARAYNRMIGKMRASRDRQYEVEQSLREKEALLAEYSRELERRVEARTLELRLSQQKFLVAFQRSPHPIVILDNQGVFLEANQTFFESSGLRPEHIVGQRIDDLGIWRDQRQRVQVLRKLRAEKGFRNQEVDIVLEPNQPRTLLVSAESMKLGWSDNSSAEVSYLVTWSDITERKQTEREILVSEKMAALGQLIAGVAHEINNPLATIRAAAENMNTNLQEVIDRFPIVTRTLAEDRYEGFLALLHEASQSQPPLSSREERKRKKALRAALQEAGVEEAAPKAEALCNAGLYAPTPAQLQLLDDPSWRDIIGLAYNLSRQQQNSHNVREAVERAAGIVMALKKYSHQGGLGERTSTSVQDTLETVLTLHHNQLKRGVEVTRHFAADVPTIQAFPNELIQVWTNLIQNALHAMEGRGILEVGVHRQGDELVVEITDNGPGVPAALQERIFEPFFTTKPMGEGSGLGLDIVRKIIERHQGRLTLESVPGRTRFSVHLPIS